MKEAETPDSRAPPFAEPTPLGLLGLAVGCAALVPVAFGAAQSPGALRTAAMFCLLFGAGGQLLAGLLGLANKNLLGGTLFTTFAFNWAMNAWVLWGLADGRAPDPAVVLSVDVCFVVVFLVLTYAFAFYSAALVLFLADVDALYLLRIARELLHAPALGTPIACCTVVLALLALWIAFALLVNPTAGRELFRLGGPLLRAHAAPSTRP